MARAPRIPKGVPSVPPPAASERKNFSKRHPEFETAIGARIRALRIAARMSQSALGKTVGLSFQQVQKYEFGKDRVAASTLYSFALALGVHPGSFFSDDMPAPIGPLADVKAVVKLGHRIQRVGNPGVIKHLLALADLLAESTDEQSSDEGNPPGHTTDPDEADRWR